MAADRWTYRHVSAMLAFYRWAFAETAGGREIALSRAGQYEGRGYDAEGWRREFRRALDERINLKAAPPPPWRKLDGLYQTELRRDCQRIRDNRQRRIALHQITTPELRRRFGHLIMAWED